MNKKLQEAIAKAKKNEAAVDLPDEQIDAIENACMNGQAEDVIDAIIGHFEEIKDVVKDSGKLNQLPDIRNAITLLQRAKIAVAKAEGK